MQIGKVHIHNIYSIQDAEFTLSDFNMLVGKNGAGKSNIINILRGFLQGGAHCGLRAPGMAFDGNLPTEPLWIEVEFNLTPAEFAALPAEQQAIPNKLRIRKNIRNTQAACAEILGENGVSGVPMDCGTYVYTKTGMKRINDKLPFDVVFIEPTNYDASFVADTHDDCEKNKRLFPADNALSRVRDVIGETELRDTGVMNQLNDLTGSGIGQSWVKQSSGMRRAQQIQYGIGTHRAPNRLTVMLCDEPENSLHPSYLSTVSESLRNFSQQENCQVLLSTHSPQLVAENATDLTNIMRVDKSGGSTRVHQYHNLAQDPIYNLTFLNNLDRAKMFFADRVILTEGETESAFFNYMIKDKMFAATPAAENVALVNCQGKFYIQYYSKILTQYGIPHTTLWDLDRGKYPQHNEDILKCFNDYLSVGYCFYENIEAFSGTTKVPNLPAQINFIQKYDDGTIDAQRRTELATLFNNLVRAPAAPEPVVADLNFKTVQAFQHVPTITAQPVALGLYKVMYKQKTK